ncbi:MAG: oxidoreductase, partial [Opitutus sp.]
VSLGRRQLELVHPKLEQLVVDFTALDQALAAVGCHDVYCCLGTTIRSAGSRENFRAVDHAAVLALGWAAQRQGARRFFLVSALGADPHSRVFYNRVKGETEEALLVLDFDTLALFRPSLLLGRRARPRLGERVLAALLWFAEPLLLGRLRKYRAIEAAAVARAMLRCSFGQGPRGLLIYSSDEIQDMGGFGM